MPGQTVLGIDGSRFTINGAPTYAGRTYRGWPIEGLLMNVRAVQAHLHHADIQTTTIYTRLAPHDLPNVVNLFDEKNGGTAHSRLHPVCSALGIPSRPIRDANLLEKPQRNRMVAPTGSDRAWRFVIEDFVPLVA